MEVSLKQAQKDLDTEKACYSKTYEDVCVLVIIVFNKINVDYYGLSK